MREQRDIWDNAWTGRAQETSDFAKSCLKDYLSPAARPLAILEIGCGNGGDAIFFARHDHRVTAIDFSRSAVTETAKAARQQGLTTVAILQVDYAQSALPFRNAAFDLVYSHLSLHYFPDALISAIIDEVWRVMKPGGTFRVRCKSTVDPLFGQGENLGDNSFCLKGHLRHFFSQAYMAQKLGRFTIHELRETSADYHGHRSAFVEAIAQRPA